MIDVNSTPAQVEKAYWSAQAHVAALSAELADVKAVLVEFGFADPEIHRAPSTAKWVRNILEDIGGQT